MKRQLALSLCCALAAGCGTSVAGDGARVHDAALSPVNWGACCPSVPVQPPVVQPPAMEPPVAEPSAAPTEDPGPPATTTTVTVRNFEFVPSQVTVAPGTTVTWKFEGPAQHTSTSDAGSAMTWDSGLKSPGESFSLTFSEKGTFSYHCTPHPRMQGTVIVEGSADGTDGDEGTDGGEDSGGSDGGDTGSEGGGDTGSTGGSGY